MTYLWTWKGKFFGYREEDALWTYKGKHVGWFVDEEIYAIDGKYLGEVKNDNRLITHRSKKSWRKGVPGRYGGRGAIAKYTNYVGFVMYAGYEDFPAPDNFY